MKDLLRHSRNFDIATARSAIDSSDLVGLNYALHEGKAATRMRLASLEVDSEPLLTLKAILADIYLIKVYDKESSQVPALNRVIPLRKSKTNEPRFLFSTFAI